MGCKLGIVCMTRNGLHSGSFAFCVAAPKDKQFYEPNTGLHSHHQEAPFACGVSVLNAHPYESQLLLLLSDLMLGQHPFVIVTY